MTTKSLILITATLLLSNTAFAEETLEEITVVSSNKTTQSLQETTSNITVITSEEIEEKGYQTVAQALSQQSGMILSGSGGMGQPTSLFTRGMDGGQTLILLDGMRLNDPSSTNGAAHLEMLSTANIKQIEILKGGQSSIWGSNASAGVINIITKQPKEGTHGSATVGYGSYNTKEISADVAYKDEKFTAQAMGSYLKTDGFSALSPRDTEADGFENKNYNLKLGYVFNENNKINASLNHIQTEVQYDGYLMPDDDKSYGTSDQKNYAINYQFTYNNYSATLNATTGEYKRKDYANGLTPPSLFNATTTEYSLINAYAYIAGKVVLGFEYKDFEDKESTSNYASYENKAIYISNLYHINEATLLETNLRYDDYNAFENKTTYKIGLKHAHKFLEGFTTSANYYTSYDAPTIYQYQGQPLYFINPNPDIKPSYTRGFDITASYKKYISITYFNNKVEDYIDYVTDPITFVSNYDNIDGKSKFSGFEVAGSYTLPSYNLTLSGNFTHLIKAKKVDDSDFLRRPQDILNANIDYYTSNEMHFGINTQYIGDRADQDFSTFPSTEVQTGDYTLWNLYFNTELVKDLNLNITARNIFDKEYEEVSSYATEGASVYAKLKYSF